MTGVLRAVVLRDLRLESAAPETTMVTVSFVIAAVLLAGLAFGPVPATLRDVGPGTIWLVALLATAPQARAVSAAERDEGAWDLVRSLVAPTTLLLGKLLSLWVRLAATWALTAVLVASVFAFDLPARAWLAGALATLGLAAVTVILGVMVSGRGGSALLTTLLLPLGLPLLLAGTVLTTPDAPGGPWFAVLVGFDLLLLAAAWATFPILLEE